MRIRIDTTQVRQVSQRLISEGDRLAEIEHELQRAIGGLDTWVWDGASRRQAEPLLSRVRPESEHVVQQLNELGRQLGRIAEAFESADHTSAAGVDTIPWFTPDPTLGWRTNPALRMGTLLAGGSAAAITLTTLPVTGTEGRVSFIDRLKGIPSTIKGWLSPAITSVAGWFGWHGGATEQPPAPAVWEELQPVETLEPGKTLDGEPALPPRPLSTAKAEITVAPLPARFLTPALKQTEKSYECAPTAASMVLKYYHTLEPDHKALEPKDLIDKLGGRFQPAHGITADELVAGMKEMDLGYKIIERKSLLDKQGLQDELKDGPVVAMVHLNWGTDKYPHMVTVTGMSDDGQTVYANDPWTGKAEEINWSTFERSWNFGEHDYSNLIVKIRP